MRPKGIVAFLLGVVLTALGVFGFVAGSAMGGVIPLLIGLTLIYLGWRGGRIAMIIFGHACIVVGCLMITWGIYLLPGSEPTLLGVITRPLFWGLFSLFGGICANYHGFCQCIRNQ